MWCSILGAVAAAATVFGPGRAGRAATLELRAEAGALAGIGTPELAVRPSLAADAVFWWAPRARFDLGLVTGLGVTSIPYGNNDGEPVIGMRSQYAPSVLDEAATYMPRFMFASRLWLSPDTAVRALVGTTFLMSGPMRGFSLIPFPTAGVAVDTRIGAARRFGLGAGLSYTAFAFDAAKGFVSPTLAVSWR